MTVTCPLTIRELEMVQGLADGLVYKQIAGQLGISVSTVRNHLSHAYGKLGVIDRAQAVIRCEREGWVARETQENDRELVAYYRGAYDQCRRLLTSPRMARPQLEVIEGEAYVLKAKLERRGVRFVPGSGEPQL